MSFTSIEKITCFVIFIIQHSPLKCHPKRRILKGNVANSTELVYNEMKGSKRREILHGETRDLRLHDTGVGNAATCFTSCAAARVDAKSAAANRLFR